MQSTIITIILLTLAITANAQTRFALQDLKTDALTDKIERKTISGTDATFGYFVFKKGAVVPEHQHINEQYTFIVQGSVKVTINKTDYLLHAGEGLIIPPNVPHRFEALEDNTIDIDFFTPRRQDWLNGTDTYFTAPSKNK